MKTKEDAEEVFKKYNEKLEYGPGVGGLPRLYNFLINIEGEEKEVEINNKYPKLLSSFVRELQQPGNTSSISKIQSWAREQSQRINQNEVRSLQDSSNMFLFDNI